MHFNISFLKLPYFNILRLHNFHQIENVLNYTEQTNKIPSIKQHRSVIILNLHHLNRKICSLIFPS